MSLKSNIKEQLKRLARPAIRQAKPASPLPDEPVSIKWGFDRGVPIVRHFTDRFIEDHRSTIRGAVLEIKDLRYTDAFGHELESKDVLDIDSSNPNATVIADLSKADNIPSDSYDCFILTDTLQYIFEMRDAISHAHRILKPGGVLLATVPSIGQVDIELKDIEYWRFTEVSCRRLLEEAFGPGQVEVTAFGNYFSCLAGLSGMAVEDIDPAALQPSDPMYPQEIGILARKLA